MQITIYKVEIWDITPNKITVYDPIRAAAREIGCNHATIIFALKLWKMDFPEFLSKYLSVGI